MAQLQTVQPTITGQLSTKRVAQYMKQRHKEIRLYVERCDDGTFFLADSFLIVKVSQSNDLFPYTFYEKEWPRATFYEKEMTATEGGANCSALWQREAANEFKPLLLTDELKEVPSVKGRPGTFYRKLDWNDLLFKPVYLDKKFTDMFSPDLDELEGFLFEGRDNNLPVRISAVNGIVAYVMPMYQKEER
jgi:hypothetical protein